ncbi:MAG: HNH endonuclease [Phycisphaera sp.]|nr:HNH endonuclease [Phycisphaera sp.]
MPTGTRRRWTRDELLVAFGLYNQIPFGHIRHGHPKIIQVANSLGRTPSALSMKLGNLASFDPELAARGVAGLANASRDDRAIFDEFYDDPEALAAESGAAWDRLIGDRVTYNDESQQPSGPTETQQVIRARRVQRFFRASVLANYSGRCAISGIALPELVIASHIIPWSVSTTRRADPRNGIALCALYDRVFDRGLMTFDGELRVKLSRRLFEEPRTELHDRLLLGVEGMPLNTPDRAPPDRVALDFHRKEVFKS